MIQRSVTEAKGQLSALVEAVSHGEEVVLTRSGRSVAKIVAFHDGSKTREPGGLKHLVLPDDFDLTSQEIIRQFEGESQS